MEKNELIELINDLLDEEDMTYEEETLLEGYLYVIDFIDDPEILNEIFLYIDDAFNNDEDVDEDFENEDFEDGTEEMKDVYENINCYSDILNELKKRIRGGKIRVYKPGFRKVGGKFKKIKQSTLRKMKRAARKKRHKKIKPNVKAKMMRSRKKVLRTKRAFLKRTRKK